MRREGGKSHVAHGIGQQSLLRDRRHVPRRPTNGQTQGVAKGGAPHCQHTRVAERARAVGGLSRPRVADRDRVYHQNAIAGAHTRRKGRRSLGHAHHTGGVRLATQREPHPLALTQHGATIALKSVGTQQRRIRVLQLAQHAGDRAPNQLIAPERVDRISPHGVDCRG